MRRGLTLVEIVVGMGILTLILIPGYTLYFQSKGAVFKSKLAIIATMAAQEEIEDLRLVARYSGASIDTDLAHGWEPFSDRGHALAVLKGSHKIGNQKGYDLTEGTIDTTDLEYPEVYERIWTRVEITKPVSGLVFPAVLHVRWQEKGETFDDADREGKKGFSRFEFHLVRTPRGN